MDRAFETAYFWRLPPSAVLEMPISVFEQHAAQAIRIHQMSAPNG